VTGARAQGDFSNRLVSLAAPGANCIAVSEAAGMVVVGQRVVTNHHFLVYKLNADGSVAVPPAPVSFPVPDQVKALKVHPIGMTLHPRLPLLYVWRDVEGTKPDSAEEKAVYDSFDHALVYALANGTMVQTNIFARGTNFLCEQVYGHLTVDYSGRRLFVPNLRDPARQTAIGYYDLDEKGQPVPIPVPVPGTLDGYGVSKYETKVLPRWINVQSFRPHTTGLGMVAPNPTTVVFSASQGLGVWDTENRRGYLGGFFYSGLGDHWIAADPSLPVVFLAAVNSHLMMRIEQADGYPTLMPQITWGVSGAAFQCRPVVIPGKPPRLALGGTTHIYVTDLDLNGKFTGETKILIGQPAPVKALAWSPKFNRLYAAVDKAP